MANNDMQALIDAQTCDDLAVGHRTASGEETVANNDMQALIDAQVKLAEEFLQFWSATERDWDFGDNESRSSIIDRFAGRDWPLQAVLDEHRVWVETDGKAGVRADFQDCDFSELSEFAQFPSTCHADDFLNCYVTLNSRLLQGANFSGANLAGLRLWAANLSHANFQGANLYDVGFSSADLTGAKFSGAYISDCTYFGCAVLQDADFRYANYETLNLSAANALGVLLPDPEPDNEEEEERRGLWFGPPNTASREDTTLSQSLFTHLLQFMPLEELVGIRII